MADIYNVTLAWGWDKNEGNYTTTVWADSENKAIRLTAEEMADNGSVKFDNAKEREEWIEDRVGGFRDVYQTSDQFTGDLVMLYAKELYPDKAPSGGHPNVNLVELGKVLAENRERILSAA